MSIRRNPRVILFERTNMRYLDPQLIEDQVDLATLDVSFISVLKVHSTSIVTPDPNHFINRLQWLDGESWLTNCSLAGFK